MEEKNSIFFWFIFILGILLIFLILILILILAFIFSFNNEIKYPLCGDGTRYNECSSVKPYYCDNGTLIERASICLCSNFSSLEGDSCISKYQTEPKNISLNYTLNGLNKKIDFVVYNGLSNHLFNLPISLEKENISRGDFKLRNINNQEQRELLLPLVITIQNIESNELDQVRIAISLVQNLAYNSSGKKLKFLGKTDLEYQRYPYETLYDSSGLCGEKTELLAFLLKELGYGSAYFYYQAENHEATGIKCPISESLNKSGYCFIETTGPAILTNDKEEYLGVGILESSPQIFVLSEGKALEKGIEEYSDADTWIKLNKKIKIYKEKISLSDFNKWNALIKKYGLDIPEFLYPLVNSLESVLPPDICHPLKQ